MSEQLGVPIVVMSGGVHRRLVERRRDDDGDATCERQLYGLDDVLISGLAAGRADLAVANLRLVLGRDVYDRHGTTPRIQRIRECKPRANEFIGALEQV